MCFGNILQVSHFVTLQLKLAKMIRLLAIDLNDLYPVLSYFAHALLFAN